jgi:hypothetical protein
VLVNWRYNDSSSIIDFRIVFSAHFISATSFDNLPDETIREILNKMSGADTTRFAKTSKTNQGIVLDHRNQPDIERFVASQSNEIKYEFRDMAKKLMLLAVTSTREFVVVKSSTIVKNIDQIDMLKSIGYTMEFYTLYCGDELDINFPMTRSRTYTSDEYRYLISIYANIPKYTLEDISSCFEIANEKIKDECVKEDTTSKGYAYSSVCGIGINIYNA